MNDAGPDLESAGAAASVLGQGEEFARLRRAARALRLPHAFVIEGQPGCGKSSVALALAADLLDDGLEATRKQVLRRSHPDLHWLTVREGKSDIKVEDVRELQMALAQNSYAGRARVAVIDPADRLNEEGQNALLKTLEEPGAATFLLLTTSRPENLLPTVRSRVGRYRVRALGAEALVRALATARPQAEPQVRAWAAQRAGGSLGLAQDLVDDPIAPALDARLLEFLAGRTRDAHALTDACLAGASGREATAARVVLVLRLLRAALRDHLNALLRDGTLDLAPDGDRAYGAPALDRWIESCEQIFAAESDLQVHVAAEQALLGLLLELAAA